jgi:hypothetical protein
VVQSVSCIQNVDEPPKVRTDDYLGHLTDLSEEFVIPSFIEEFVSVGRKNCVLSFDRKTYDQIQGKWYKLELRKFKGCKLHIEGYDSERPPHACT